MPKKSLILIGSGPLERDFKRRLVALGLSEKVYMAGHVNEPTMAAYLYEADIYVTTSLSGRDVGFDA